MLWCPGMEVLQLQVDMLSHTVEGMLLFFPVLLDLIIQVALRLHQGESLSTTNA